ncbi:mucin-2 [Anastrepha ludens]|uniref:mucin-2 n=1 Tax=Anastrepha ludens TaxID=28586 RepID=UPI0023B0515F|nr:mucin-2 [Anastrepha ludens]XP_053965149.1 mucin-2 [Anastrepha ludens]
MDYRYFLIAFILNVNPILSDNGDGTFVTQTVYGFLDFTTTIGNTVMVFSPQSAPSIEKIDIPTNIIETKPFVEKPSEDESIKPTKSTNSVKLPTSKPLEKKNLKSNIVEAQKNTKENNNNSNSKVTISNSVVVAAQAPAEPVDEPPTLQIENNVYEYDLLSRQPAEYAEETYRVINNKASDKPRNRLNQRRTYDISSAASVTHETTTSRLKTSQAPDIKPHSPTGPKGKKPKIRSTAPLRILKTTTPTLPKPGNSPQEQKSNRLSGSNRQNGKGNRSNGNEKEHVSITESVVESSQVNHGHKKSSPRSKPKRKSKNNRSSAAHKSSAVILASSAEPTRKTFRSKVRPSNVEAQASTSVYMFKLNRTPGRWQYTTTPKPRVSIRKNAEGNTTKSVDPFAGNPNLNIISENGDLESSGSQNGAVVNNIDQGGNYQHLVETLNVEISTPADFKDTYYELATIKTPYAFQVGGLKKTRFITVTSTIEKTLTPDPTEVQIPDGPLTENILATSTREPNFLRDSGVTTLKALHISENAETPSLETVVDSFSTTLKKLRTQVLPIVYDINNETSYVTLTQTYDITSLITVTKTLSPLETDIPLRSFTDFGANLDEAGSEINLELEFGDEDNAENSKDDKPYRAKFSDIADLFGKSSNLTSEEIQRLALWKLQNGSQQFSSLNVPSIPQFTPESTLPFPSIAPSINPFLLPLQQFQTITSSIVHETIATQTNSKVLKLTFGARTAYTTIFSSEVVPTRATSYIITSIPVQPTPPAFPGYFPPPYPQYYLG